MNHDCSWKSEAISGIHLRFIRRFSQTTDLNAGCPVTGIGRILQSLPRLRNRLTRPTTQKFDDDAAMHPTPPAITTSILFESISNHHHRHHHHYEALSQTDVDHLWFALRRPHLALRAKNAANR